MTQRSVNCGALEPFNESVLVLVPPVGFVFFGGEGLRLEVVEEHDLSMPQASKAQRGCCG